MQDRVPLYPGRVTLTPVEGQPNTYDMMRADHPTQTGTPLSKANLLKDTTAAQFGLATTAVPDDVLSWVGKYNEYWWSSIVPETYGYVESKTYLNESGSKNYYQYYYNNSPITIQYSKEITIDQATGAVTLKNPIDFTATRYSTFYGNEKTLVLQELAALAPCYLTGLYTVEYLGHGSKGSLSSDIIFLPADCTYGWGSSSSTITGGNNGYASQYSFAINASSSVTVKASLVASSYTKIADAGDTIYLHSLDRNAYPDSGNGVIATKTLGAASEQKISCVIISGMQIVTSVKYSSTYEYNMSSGAGVLGTYSYVKIDAQNDDASDAEVLRGKYFTLNDGTGTELTSGTIYYATDSAVVTKGSDTDGNPYISIVAAPVTFDVTESDGITYTYLGRPFEKFPTMPQIETGSYTGTGTYGSSNPNSLTFLNTPKLLFIFSHLNNTNMHIGISSFDRGMKILRATSVSYCYTTWTDDNKTVSWYSSDDAIRQLNSNNSEYTYYAMY